MKNRIEAVRKKLESCGIRGIELSEKGKSILLQGELPDYGMVVKCGKIASKFKYKGVINDIETKDRRPAEISKPSVRDNSLDGHRCDVLIIGGGVIGCSIARELSKYCLDILLIEKECDVAMQASSRNDGMIHPGIATHLNGNTAAYNIRGNPMYTQLCKELDIPLRRNGNLILFAKKSYHMLSPLFAARSRQLRLPYRHLSEQDVKKLEPNITDIQKGGFIYPTSGVLSPYKLTVALAENAVQNGVRISLTTICEKIIVNSEEITEVVTNRGRVLPSVVINAAGVWADKIAGLADDRFFTIHPRKGDILILDKKKGPLFSSSLGVFDLSMTKGDTKGGGLVRTIDDNILEGPNAYEVMDREDYSTERERINAVIEKQTKLIKGISPSDVITYFSGIRAPTYEESFIVEASEKVKNLVHAAGIQSPGLASAPAIAEDIAAIATKILSRTMAVNRKEKYNPQNKLVNMHGLSLEEKQKLIKSNPDYGIIVCRCEEISKGEIIDALNSPIPVTTLDGIKRRVRPGMGRCQGGFCSPVVAQLIAEKTGCRLTEVTKKGGDSLILTGTTGKGEKDDV